MRAMPLRAGYPCSVRNHYIYLVLALASGQGCSPGEDQDGPGHEVWDSGGVEVVESHRPAWEGGQGWSLDSEASLRIGLVDGDEAFQFDGITGAVRLPSGTVVVADGGSQEIRFFGQDGGFLRSAGRAGEGPGEFTGLSALGRDGEGGVWAYDFLLRRITWLDGSGDLAAVSSLGMEPAMLNAVAPLPDGTFVLKQLWGAEEVSGAGSSGLRRDPIAVVRFERSGTLADTLGLFPGREIYLFEEDGRGVMGTPPFARNTVVAIRRGRVVVGDQSSFQLAEFAASGELVRSVRVSEVGKPVGPQEMESFLRQRLADAPPEDHPAIRRSVEGMPRPETMPAYGGILGDSEGNLWVSEWAMYPETPAGWAVFGEDGVWLGSVAMPPRFLPLDIGPDWVLGVEQDELDVESLALYPLRKD